MINAEDVRRWFDQRNAWTRRMLRACFRRLHGDALSEAIQNAHALTYKYVLSQAVRGKIQDEVDLDRFVRSTMYYAVIHTRRGRTVSRGTERRDALDHVENRRDRTPPLNAIEGTYDRPDELAALRVDFSAFVARLSDRRRLMLLDMLAGLSGLEIAAKYGVSPGAVSQWRRKFAESWASFADM